MALEDGRIDLDERLVVGEHNVVDREHADEAWIDLVAASASSAHGRIECHILKLLPTKILFSVIHAALLKEQLQQGDGLLCAIAGK